MKLSCKLQPMMCFFVTQSHMKVTYCKLFICTDSLHISVPTYCLHTFHQAFLLMVWGRSNKAQSVWRSNKGQFTHVNDLINSFYQEVLKFQNFKFLKKNYISFSIIINNANIFKSLVLTDHLNSDVEKTFGTNLRACFWRSYCKKMILVKIIMWLFFAITSSVKLLAFFPSFLWHDSAWTLIWRLHSTKKVNTKHNVYLEHVYSCKGGGNIGLSFTPKTFSDVDYMLNLFISKMHVFHIFFDPFIPKSILI